MAFIRSGGHRAIFKGLDRQKIMLIPGMAQMMSTSRPPIDGQKQGDAGSGSSGKGAAVGIGTILAIGGLGYAYHKHGDDEAIRSKINFLKGTVGLAKSAPNGNSGTDIQANCAGKDDCEKKCEDSDCLRKMDKEEEMIAKANSDLEKALKDVKPKAVEATDAALKAYCEASEAIKKFMDRAYCAIENDNLESPQFEEIWCEVYDLAVKRCEKVKDAMTKGQCAWELLCRLREVIDNGKNCKYTQCNPLLLTAEETLLCAERELLNAKARMDCIQSESKLVEQYRNLIEDFRRDLKGEVDSLLTGDKECRSTLTENECTMILTHAYKKVLRIQMELSQCQAKSFSLGFDGPNRPSFGGKLEQMKEFYEGELIKALSRQNLLYQENFELAKQVLQNEFDIRLKEKDGVLEKQHLNDLANIYKRATESVSSVKSALNDQKLGELKSDKLRKLWAYCNSIYSRINFVDQISEKKDVPIKINKDQLISEFSGDNFVVQLLETIPTNVESTQSLKRRFFNTIDKTCRNLATFRKDEGFTLWKYAIGSIQGLLTTRCDGENTTPKSVYELLDKTAFYLRRGELLDAVSTLNQLEGLPREVCKDWLLDARSALETSQTLFVLMVHANSVNVD